MADRGRLKRAKLIERVRTAEKRKVAADAYEAEARRARLAGISERTMRLGQAYSARSTVADGDELRGVVMLSAQLHALGITAAKQADHAQKEADARLADLASADRRQKRAEEQRRGLARLLDERNNRPVLSTTRQTGTELET
ncbi:hypothetical protein [Altererythrobacter sp. Root672]|uniref:hypothetical protein n=1 Tax=Altererythrobacter sp. Root672 TaxID=1736584 RepID=UPI0012E3BDA6|nr:hypothetical protein [Altererythrobacter sp. Root672]